MWPRGHEFGMLAVQEAVVNREESGLIWVPSKETRSLMIKAIDQESGSPLYTCQPASHSTSLRKDFSSNVGQVISMSK